MRRARLAKNVILVGVSRDRPAVVQGDRTVLLEVDHPSYEQARDVLARFAELERSPEHVHTYRLSALALWNAAALGVTADEVVAGLAGISRFEIPAHVEHEIRELLARHGVCRIVDGPDPTTLWLEVDSEPLRVRIEREPKLAPLVVRAGARFQVAVVARGLLKRGLLAIGYPVEDVAGLVDGAPLALSARRDVFEPYPYQVAAVRR